MNQYRINDTRTENQLITFMLAEDEEEAVTDYLDYLITENPMDEDRYVKPVKGDKIISAQLLDLNDLSKVHEIIWFGIKPIGDK